MRRAWKITDASQRAELLIQRRSSSLKPKTLIPPQTPTSSKPTNDFRFLHRGFSDQSSSTWPSPFSCLIGLFDNFSVRDPKVKEDLICKVSSLKDELVRFNGDSEGFLRVLDEKGLPLFASYVDGSALIELLAQLYQFPQMAVQVFNWRRNHPGFNFPITPEEYSKGITVAGRARNVDHAVELFREAANNGSKTSSTYNALLGVYMSNGLSEKCQSLFRELKAQGTCKPTVVTYNILISVFGNLLLIHHMEATLQEIYDSNLFPNLSTFNNLISGYITAWMWDRMENTYNIMKQRSIEPDTHTYLLMLRGYSHSGQLEKMENMYQLVKKRIDRDILPYIICMICAYCKTPSTDRIEKIEELMKLIPEGDYRPWLNVLLIRVYAQEKLLEKMEKLINDAFEHKTAVRTLSVVRAIITAYYRFNSVDRLVAFVKRAECEGWRLCRSIYHCKMVLYGSQNRLEEMENVLDEMEKVNLNSRTKKTLIIMYKAYSFWGPRYKVEQIVGLMCKHGYGILLDDCPS